MLPSDHEIDDDWVRAELRQAYKTLKLLPESDRRPGIRLMFPQQSSLGNRTLPTPGEISRMDAALRWLEFLKDEDRCVRSAVALLAVGLSQRQAARSIGGLSQPTVAKREAQGIAMIVARLRGMTMVVGFDTIARRAA